MPLTFILMWIATLAIAGFPFLSGFYSKDEILTSVFARAHGSTLAEASWLGIPGSTVLYAVYFLGLAAALLTAIYMTRMMIYTFHGPNRTGETERRHLREAPWVMTGPLVVLGALSLLGGLLNLPALPPFNLGGLVPEHLLDHWLEPVVGAPALAITNGVAPHLEHSTEYMLVGAAIAVGIVGIIGAFLVLKPDRLTTKAAAPAPRGAGKVLENKYYVDEAYDAAVVRPVVQGSRKLLWRGIDVGLIDGLFVNGAAWLARGFAWAGSQVQSGQLGTYAWAIVVGVLLVLGVYTIG
jgi:NADH-quinone oxidoreductase subunit L